MKNKNAILRWAAMLLLIPSFMQGQSLSAKAFFSSDTVSAVYLGIDFTVAKLINDDASNAETIQSTQFNGINDLMVHEAKKYDIQEAYHRVIWATAIKSAIHEVKSHDYAQWQSGTGSK